jgi:tight adherence protein C
MHPAGAASRIERPPFLIALIARLGGFLPARDGKDALRSGLVAAGYRGQEAPLVFLGSKALLAVALPMLWVGYAYLEARPLGNALMISAGLAVAGFYLPSMFLSYRKRQRHGEIMVALPDALDLLVVCVEAGLGMPAAVQRVAGEIRLASPALSDELALVHQQMQAGVSRADSLRNLAQRTGVGDVYSLVAMLIQTDRLGTSVAQALRAHAESMRVRRKQRAEQLARKASIKLAFPLVFLVLPALLIIILGPAAIQLMKALVSD